MTPVDAADGEVELAPLRGYVILEQIGEGGYGQVYAAFDLKLDRKVAIKVMRDHAPRPRLLREAKAMARMSDPNVVQVYETGEYNDAPAIVMEFVDGVDLRAWLESEPRTQQEILTIFMAAGQGLAAAHRRGVVHRDFKPANVMVGKDGRARVTDFGLALGEEFAAPVEIAELTTALDSRLTATDAVVGTLAYMPPEHLERGHSDSRADQFSFCVSLWEALCGELPIGEDDTRAFVRALANGRYRMPTRVSIPTWLRDVLLRGMETDPAQRWPSMDALLAALGASPVRRRRLVAGVAGLLTFGAGIVLANSVAEERAAARIIADCDARSRAVDEIWNDETRTGIARAVAGTQVRTSADIWNRTAHVLDEYTAAWSEVRRQSCLDASVDGARDAALQASVDACLDEQLALISAVLGTWSTPDDDQVVHMLKAVYSLPPVDLCVDENYLRQFVPLPDDDSADGLRDDVQEMRAAQTIQAMHTALAVSERILDEHELSRWPHLDAEVHLVLGDARARLGDYGAASVDLHHAFLVATANADQLTALEAAIRLGKIIGDGLANHSLGLFWTDMALALTERSGLRGSIFESDARGYRGEILFKSNRFAEAHDELSRARDIAVATFGPRSTKAALAHSGVGMAFFAEGKYDQAFEALELGLEIDRELFGQQHPDVGTSYYNIGLVQHGLGRYEEALDTLSQAKSIYEAVYGDEHPHIAEAWNVIANIRIDQSMYDEALVGYQNALEINIRLHGEEHPSVAMNRCNLGHALSSAQKYEQAVMQLEAGLAVLDKASSEHPDLRATCLVGLGLVKDAQGRYEEAIAYQVAALAIKEQTYEPDHPSLVPTLYNLGTTHYAAGQLQQALDYFRRSLAIAKDKLGPEHPNVFSILAIVGCLGLELREFDVARANIDAALKQAETVGAPLDEVATVKFCKARSLWHDGDHAQARALGEGVLSDLQKDPKSDAAQIEEVSAWLAEAK